MPHDNRAGKERNDAGQSHELAQKVGEVAIQQNERGFLDGVFVDRLVDLEEVAEAEAA